MMRCALIPFAYANGTDSVPAITDDKWPMTNKSFDSQPIGKDDLRVLLWDLDGTLVRGKRLGSYKDYTAPMLESIFGTSGSLHQMVVSGMTDLQIVEEALRSAGITREHITARKDALIHSYS